MQLQESNRIFQFSSNKRVFKSLSQPVNQVVMDEENPISNDSEYSDPEFNDSSDSDMQNLEEEDEITSIELMVNTAKKEESEVHISCNLFSSFQKELTPSNRESVVKWLIKLNYYFHLTNDVLFNTITFLDILFCNKTIKKTDISIYAAVCYWISSKVDTRAQPSVKEFNEASGFQFTKELFAKKETEIISMLNYKLHYPTTKFFMRQLQDEFYSRNDTDVIDFSRFLSEVSIIKFEFLDYKPSIIASSILIIASSSFGHMGNAIDVAVKEIKYGTDVNCIKKCVDLLMKYASLLMNENKDSKSRGIKELFDKADMNFDVEEILQIAVVNINEKS